MKGFNWERTLVKKSPHIVKQLLNEKKTSGIHNGNESMSRKTPYEKELAL
jgi:hypothetical protein